MYTHDVLPNLSEIFSAEVGIAKLQPLWVLLSATAKSIGEDFYIFQFLHAIVVNAVIFRFIQKNTRFQFTGVLLYYFTLYPFFNFEILREALAVCFFLLSIPYYKNRKWIPYYLLITIAFLFHLSAIFLFLLPIVRNIRLEAPGLLLLFSASAILNPAMHAFASSSTATGLIGFAIGGYIDYKYTVFGLISIFILYLLVPYFLTWLTQNKLKIELKYAEMAYQGLPIAAMIPIFFIFYRFFNYFAILYILMACEAAHSIIQKRNLRKIRLVTVPIIFSIALVFYTARYFSDTSDIVSSTRWHIRWHPYHSIFDPVNVPEREQMIKIQNLGQQR